MKRGGARSEDRKNDFVSGTPRHPRRVQREKGREGPRGQDIVRDPYDVCPRSRVTGLPSGEGWSLRSLGARVVPLRPRAGHARQSGPLAVPAGPPSVVGVSHRPSVRAGVGWVVVVEPAEVRCVGHSGPRPRLPFPRAQAGPRPPPSQGPARRPTP